MGQGETLAKLRPDAKLDSSITLGVILGIISEKAEVKDGECYFQPNHSDGLFLAEHYQGLVHAGIIEHIGGKEEIFRVNVPNFNKLIAAINEGAAGGIGIAVLSLPFLCIVEGRQPIFVMVAGVLIPTKDQS